MKGYNEEARNIIKEHNFRDVLFELDRDLDGTPFRLCNTPEIDSEGLKECDEG